MKNLTNKPNEEICEFLLNNKSGNCLELNPDKGGNDNSGFVSRVIYKDKNIEIIFSYLIIAEDDIIQQFFIYSNWWGKIKNSFFTCDGSKGKSELKCGVINIDELKFSKQNTTHQINNKNETAKIEIIDFNSLVAYCQRKFKASPSYNVVEVLSLSPNSWVKIEVIMPDGIKHYFEDTSKKEAANSFAIDYAGW